MPVCIHVSISPKHLAQSLVYYNLFNKHLYVCVINVQGHGRKHKWENITLRTIFLCGRKTEVEGTTSFSLLARLSL